VTERIFSLVCIGIFNGYRILLQNKCQLAKNVEKQQQGNPQGQEILLKCRQNIKFFKSPCKILKGKT
jgi:hypothetical protein